MKICLVNAEFVPNRSSGQAVYAEKIAMGLSRRHDVTVITAHKDRRTAIETLDRLRVIRIPVSDIDPSKWIAFGFRAGRYLEQLKRSERFDIIHFLDAHVAFNFSGNFVASLHQSFNQRLKGNKGLPYHSSLLNLVKRYPYYLAAKLLEKKAISKAKAFVSVSEATKLEFTEHYNIEPSLITVVYNGIDTEHFKPTEFGALKQRLRIGDEKVLLYVGFSTPRKGLETLAEALNLLTEKNFKLVMVGKWEKGYKEKFCNLVGANDHRIIEAGYVPDQDMPAYYSMADVFVLPSLLEGFGFPLVEAMACGTPVVSTNVGAIPEVVNKFGAVIPPQNAPRLAEAIDRCLMEEMKNKSFLQKVRDRVKIDFNQDVMVRETLDFYQQVVDSKHLQ